MALPAHSYARLIEDAVVALLKADTTGLYQAFTNADGSKVTPSVVRQYDYDGTHQPLAVVVVARDLTNAMLGATGLGSQWRVTLTAGTLCSIPYDPENDSADRVHGAVERYLATSLTVAALNTQLGVGSVITIHGKTSAEVPDALNEGGFTLARTAAVTLHFGVS